MNEGPRPIPFFKAANDNFSKEELAERAKSEKEIQLHSAEVAFEEKIEEFMEMGELDNTILLRLQDEVLERVVHFVENSGTKKALAFAYLKNIFLEYQDEKPDQELIDNMSANFIKAFKAAYPEPSSKQ